MTPQKVREVLRLYETSDRVMQGMHDPDTPARIPGSAALDVINSERDELRVRRHLVWMCREAAAFPDEKVEKMMRWLGFIQGCLFCFGAYTLDELKRHNMPDPGESS